MENDIFNHGVVLLRFQNVFCKIENIDDHFLF